MSEPLTIDRLRSPRNSLGKLALPKGLMEWAVQDAWDKATSPVGDPANGIEMHDLAALADAICDYLETALAAQPSAEPGLDVERLAAALCHGLHSHWGPSQITEGHRLGHESDARTVAAEYDRLAGLRNSVAGNDHRELASRFWVHYRCGYVGCEIVEQHEHGGGPPMREMTPDADSNTLAEARDEAAYWRRQAIGAEPGEATWQEPDHGRGSE